MTRTGITNALEAHSDAAAVALLSAAFLLRLALSAETSLSPDEAHYFEMSLADSPRALYWASRGTHHPPLLIVLLHFIGKLSHAEWSLRLAPVIAGAIFPWFVYRWLRLTVSAFAGLLALGLLAFAPELIALSAQVRGYTLAFLSIAASLYFLELAVERGSARWMGAAALSLYMGILAEFFVAYFAAALSVYFLLRIRGGTLARPVLLGWGIMQAGGVLLYAFLYMNYIHPLLQLENAVDANRGWLADALLGPGEAVIPFVVTNTLQQFAYAFATIPPAVMLAGFAGGLVVLCFEPEDKHRNRSHAIIALLALPFLLACLGGIAAVHPYGRTRHTAFLAIFIAAGVAVALDWLLRRRRWLAAPLFPLFVLIWHGTHVPEPGSPPRAPHRAELLAGIEYLKQRVPPGTPVLSDGETGYVLNYYLGPGPLLRPKSPYNKREFQTVFRLISYRWAIDDERQLWEDLRRFREEYGWADKPVWIVEGGYNLVPYRSGLPGWRRFGEAVNVIRVGPAESLPDAEVREDSVQDVVDGGRAGDGVDGL